MYIKRIIKDKEEAFKIMWNAADKGELLCFIRDDAQISADDIREMLNMYETYRQANAEQDAEAQLDPCEDCPIGITECSLISPARCIGPEQPEGEDLYKIGQQVAIRDNPNYLDGTIGAIVATLGYGRGYRLNIKENGEDNPTSHILESQLRSVKRIQKPNINDIAKTEALRGDKHPICSNCSHRGTAFCINCTDAQGYKPQAKAPKKPYKKHYADPLDHGRED